MAWTLTFPSIVLLVVTLGQRQQKRRLLTFAPGGLVAASIEFTTSALALCLLGYIGAAIAIILIPIGVVSLLFSWVQPRDSFSDVALTALLGAALTVFGAWFVGRADEYLNEALVSGIGAVLIVVACRAPAARRRGPGLPPHIAAARFDRPSSGNLCECARSRDESQENVDPG